jgi:hypothetical protein
MIDARFLSMRATRPSIFHHVSYAKIIHSPESEIEIFEVPRKVDWYSQ